MHQPPHDQGSGALGLAVVLAAVAGFVDSHVYLHVADVFVANMSGNLIRLGMFTGLESWREAWRSAAVVPAFVLGAALGTSFNRRDVRHTKLGRVRVLLVVETVLVLAIAVILVVAGDRTSQGSLLVETVVIVVGSAAMGLQAAALGRVGSIAVTTTYGTGSLVRLAQTVVRPAPGRPVDASGRSRVIGVLVAVLCSYVSGAAIAARAGGSPWLMLLPAVALAGAAVWGRPLASSSRRRADAS